jgi:predicted homoserine dehydrogenase-like protein
MLVFWLAQPRVSPQGFACGEERHDGFARKKGNQSRVGFIGLGIMGRPMLKNLLKADHKVVALSSNLRKLAARSQDEPSAHLRIVTWARELR